MRYLMVLCLFAAADAWWFDGDKNEPYPNWNKLSVTWKKFSKLPMREQDAKDGGWRLTADGCRESVFYLGKQYTLKGDTGTMLLFGYDGHVVGIQMAMPKDTKVFTKALTDGPFITMAGKIYLTAYFTDVDNICRKDRTGNKEVVGEKLILQMKAFSSKTTSDKVLMEIPLKEKDIGSTKWMKGKCFWSMGRHYWYNISADMDCEAFFPMFLLYNGGELNGFGWASAGYLDSPRVEHPPSFALGMFFPKKLHPKCLAKEVTLRQLTTQHVFLDKRPYFNSC